MQAQWHVIWVLFFGVGLKQKNDYRKIVTDAQPTLPVSPPRTWAEINLSNLRHNYAAVINQHQGCVLAVLKAGGYGHGIVEMAMELEKINSSSAPTFMGVASVIEARQLADAGINTRIYLLGPACPSERKEIVARDWTPCVSSLEEAEDFNRIAAARIGINPNTKLRIHLAVDTGMGRGGFLAESLVENFDALEKLDFLELEGIGSHLPSADEDEVFTHSQFEIFDSLIESLGIERFRFRHLANSAGLMNYQSRTTNLCRPGLMLYGISPLAQFQSILKPVMSLKSRVSLVRHLPAGHGISYGRDTVLEKDTRVATVGIGYGDGYPREISAQHAKVWIKQQKCSLLGRVTMDQIMVDVSNLPDCVSGDEVELFGENILVSEVAQKANTIPWAVLSGITPRVTRVYINA